MNSPATGVALIYALFAAGWVLFSDSLVALLLSLPEMLRAWENDAVLLTDPGDLPARCRDTAHASIEAVESAYPNLAG